MQLLCLTGAACSGKANSCLLPIHCHIPLQALCLPQFLRSFSSPPSLLLPQFLLRYILLNSNYNNMALCPTNCNIHRAGGDAVCSLCWQFLFRIFWSFSTQPPGSYWDWAFFRLYLYTYSQHCILLMYKDFYGSGEKGQPALMEDELENTKKPSLRCRNWCSTAKHQHCHFLGSPW